MQSCDKHLNAASFDPMATTASPLANDTMHYWQHLWMSPPVTATASLAASREVQSQ